MTIISPRELTLPVTSLFTRAEPVGKGAYGSVYRALHNATGTVVALKIIEMDTPDDDLTELQREVALLSSLRDADKNNCTAYHGCWLHKTQLWIAMDFASGGSIRTIMKSCKIEEKYVVLIMRETLVALAYLHRQGIIHRDIKAANILLTQTGKILLCDFGVAAALQTQNKRSTFIGTPYWMAPEVIDDSKMYDTKADIWSLGVTCYETATGNPPFSNYEPLRAIQMIPRNPPAKLDPNEPWSAMMREFLACCLTENPSERLSAEDLLKSKWIRAHAKVPVVNLRELISRYGNWINSGNVRQSLLGIEDSPSTDDSREFGSESSWDWSPIPSDDYGGSNLGTDLDYATKRPAKSLASSRNHPLMRLFDDGNVVSANAAANAYGLGFPISSSSMDMRQSSSQAQVVIPNFPEDGDDDEPFLRTARKREDSLPNRDMSSPTTLRAPGLPRANGSFSLAGMAPSPSLEAPPQHRRPSSPADSRPTSPSFPTPTESRFPPDVQNQPVPTSPSMPTVQYGRGEEKRPALSRSRANTAPSQDAYGSTPVAATNSAPSNATQEQEKASPPALRRKGRSGTNTSDTPDRPHGRKTSIGLNAPAEAKPVLKLPPPILPAAPSFSNGELFPLVQPIKPLDYMSLGSSAEVHAELEKTCHDLAAWFGSIEQGLGNILSV